MEDDVSSGQKIGARLKELRAKKGLTQDQVAERMGLTFADRGRQVAVLESGRNPNPTINVLSCYLRAVGAEWSAIGYLLDKRELPPIPAVQAEKAAETLAAKSDLIPEPASKPKPAPDVSPVEKVISRTQETTQAYQRGMATPRHGVPAAPGVQKEAVRNYQQYRLEANVVRVKVRSLLGGTTCTAIQFHGFQLLATKVLGALRRIEKIKDPVKREATRTSEMATAFDFARANGLDTAIAEKVCAVVTEVLENWQAQPPTAGG